MVNIQDALAVGEEFDELHGEALAAYQVSIRVGVDGDRGDLPVAHAEPIDHDVSDVSALGFQAKILLEYPLAAHSSCSSHSLNLVGVHSAKCCPAVMTFFINLVIKFKIIHYFTDYYSTKN